MIDSAISQLENSSEAFCQAQGSAARARFQSSTGGFIPGDPQIDPDGYVWMYEDSNSPTGWSPSDEYIYLSSASGYSSYDMADLIAHEETHQQGYPPNNSYMHPSCP